MKSRPRGGLNLYDPFHEDRAAPFTRKNSNSNGGLTHTFLENSMAKDGTKRGGRRPGAGRKPKALIEKLNEGKEVDILSEGTSNLKAFKSPEPEEYMRQKQKAGIDLNALHAFDEICAWLKERGCLELVNPYILRQYAMSVARWAQCETALNEFGLLAKHPTTGAPIASPFQAMANSYLKQAESLWYSINQIVKENCSTPYSDSPQEDLMARLLDS